VQWYIQCTSHCHIQQQHSFQDTNSLSLLQLQLNLQHSFMNPNLTQWQEVLTGTNLWWLRVQGTLLAHWAYLWVLEHVLDFFLCYEQECKSCNIFLDHLYKFSGVRRWFPSVAWRLVHATSHFTVPPIPTQGLMLCQVAKRKKPTQQLYQNSVPVKVSLRSFYASCTVNMNHHYNNVCSLSGKTSETTWCVMQLTKQWTAFAVCSRQSLMAQKLTHFCFMLFSGPAVKKK
jgi:hypothetical protein